MFTVLKTAFDREVLTWLIHATATSPEPLAATAFGIESNFILLSL